jgi:predicted small secreted protein
MEYKMNKNSRSAAKLLLILSIVLAIGACNTVAGVGKDTQKAGEAIEDASGKD